jgi:hypothetical protein
MSMKVRSREKKKKKSEICGKGMKKGWRIT